MIGLSKKHGAGNDAFVARAIVGEVGKVLGLDMTEPMIEKAGQNANKLGFKSVEFRLGDIKEMPNCRSQMAEGWAKTLIENTD